MEKQHRTCEEILAAQKRRNKRREDIKECLVGTFMGLFMAGLLMAAILYDGSSAQASGTVPDIPKDIITAAEEIGAEYSICPELLEAIAYKESGCDETAVGDGCIGLMQIAPRWHQDRMTKLGITDLTDGYQNMKLAADYLAELFEKYEDVGEVLMRYNGDSNAAAYSDGTFPLSDYAETILTLSEALERKHGK